MLDGRRRYSRAARPFLLIGVQLVLICGLLAPAPAAAYHTDVERETRGTAYTLQRNEWKLGLWSLEYGILDSLDVQTYTLPWAGYIADAGVPNITAKYRYSWRDWSVAGRVGIFHMNEFEWNVDPATMQLMPQLNQLLGGAQGGTVTLDIIPIEAMVSKPLSDQFTLSLGAVYTLVEVPVAAETEEQRTSVGGAAAVTNLQFTGGLDYRWTQVTALLLRLRYVAYQVGAASAAYSYGADPFTTVTVYGGVTANDYNIQNGYSAVLTFAWSWSLINLHVGAGYGNWNVAPLNIVSPIPVPIVDFDLYARW